MNMLTNKVPFGLLSEDEQEVTRSFGDHLEYYYFSHGMDGWNEVKSFSGAKDHVYRLKLKEGDWYKIKSIHGHDYYYKCASICDDRLYNEINEMYLLYSDIESIRPATQEEINSVKPKFKRGDVVGFCDDAGTYGRLGDVQDCVFHGLSRVNCMGQFDFKVHSWIAKNDIVKATPDQIKQLKLEEMKHGKKWNGEGYDDWLTANGLTLNELLEHDLSEIEFEHNQGWGKSLNTKEAINVSHIKEYRLKPQETFVDVEIEWVSKMAEARHPENNKIYNITAKPVGWTLSGWVLSGYVFDCAIVRQQPLTFAKEWTKVVQKATHARFVKVN